jgi:hypothetical protein
LVVVLSVSILVVSRLHKIFGSQDLNANAGKGIEIVQFNPKVVVYDISGPPGATANINYWDADANTHQQRPAAVVDHPLDHAACGERQHHGPKRRQPDHLQNHRGRCGPRPT